MNLESRKRQTNNLKSVTPCKVTILGFDQAYGSTITGALDLLALAGVSWERLNNKVAQPKFQVEIASYRQSPIQCINKVVLHPHVAIESVETTDLLLIPTIGGKIEEVLTNNRMLLHYIRAFAEKGTDIASNCSGAFLLAEAGVLNGKKATTHWGYADLFAQRYPNVKLNSDAMITQSDNIFCAGGGMAWFDLTLMLIERYCGYDVATHTAKAHVLDRARVSQSAYANLSSKKYHQDQKINEIQQWLEDNFSTSINLQSLASNFNLTFRTFSRRFKQAAGVSPLQYLQQLRIEKAKMLLESSQLSLAQIVNNVGYDDNSSFAKLFKRNTALSPNQYRKKFRG